MRNFALVLLMQLCCFSPCFAGITKRLTAVISDRNMSKQEYKTLEKFATGLGKDIKKNWFPAEYPNSLRTVVKIDFSPDGSHHYEFRERSNNQGFDDTCYMAINRSLQGLSYPHVMSVEYLFEYKNRKLNLPSDKLIKWPAQLGVGYLTKKMGINPFVSIPIY